MDSSNKLKLEICNNIKKGRSLETRISFDKIESKKLEQDSVKTIYTDNLELENAHNDLKKMKTEIEKQVHKELIPSEGLKNSQNNKNSSNIYKLGYLNYLFIIIKLKKYCLCKNEKLFLEGEKCIQKEMDIFYILKKLQEIEKLKQIILNKNQF